jgi:hypothetical protein
MKVVNNEKLIRRNKRLSQYVLYFSLALLVVGLIWSFSGQDIKQYTIAYIFLIPAYILVQVSIYMANKWGRTPRPDEIIVQSLKGINDQYTLFNYICSVPHVLIGPAGLFLIKPYHQAGEITYNDSKHRFEQKGGASFIAKTFGQENLTNIERESKIVISDLFEFLKKKNISLPVEPRVINLFFSEKAYVSAKNAPEVTLHADKLKDYLRNQAKSITLKDDQINTIKKQILD